MSKRDPCLFLGDILEAIGRIEEYTTDHTLKPLSVIRKRSMQY